MIRRVQWSPSSSEDLLDIPWRSAEEIVAAVTLFAVASEGPVIRWPSPRGAEEVRLYVPGTRYYVRLRYSESVVYVERVFTSP